MTPDRRNLLRLANSPSLGASFKFKLLINRTPFVTAGTECCQTNRTTSLSAESGAAINFNRHVTRFSLSRVRGIDDAYRAVQSVEKIFPRAGRTCTRDNATAEDYITVGKIMRARDIGRDEMISLYALRVIATRCNYTNITDNNASAVYPRLLYVSSACPLLKKGA